MDSKPKIKKSTIAGLITLCFFGGVFALGMSDPPGYYLLVICGILFSSLTTIWYWNTERRQGAKTSPIGIYILVFIAVVFLLLSFLPAFGEPLVNLLSGFHAP